MKRSTLWEWVGAVIFGPLILGILLWIDWSNRRWSKQELRRQEQWKKDHPDWYR